jgi:hypothetical protein
MARIGGTGLSSPATQGSTNRRIVVQDGPDIKQDPNSKLANIKRAGRIVQVLVCLPSKHKVLSSMPSTTKTHKQTKNQDRVPAPSFASSLPLQSLLPQAIIDHIERTSVCESVYGSFKYHIKIRNYRSIISINSK